MFLPQNLYSQTKNGKRYFQYRNPVTGKYHGLGTNMQKAVKIAQQANAQLAPAPVDQLNAILTHSLEATKGVTIADMIDIYEADKLPHEGLKARSLENKQQRLNRIRREIGDTELAKADTAFIAHWLDSNFQKDPYKKVRALLIKLFDIAKQKGHIKSENPVNATDKTRGSDDKLRTRMTIEQYKALYNVAPVWMQVAMEFSLITLQGRNEVVTAKYSDIDTAKNTIKIIRKKTDKNEWAFMEIKITPALQKVIDKSRADNLLSPYIVHYSPRQRPAKQKQDKTKDHWTQVTGHYLNQQMLKLRQELPEYNHLPVEQQPTFHEIRALGSHLYDKAGFSDSEYVQPLMAHADVDMTKKYQAGHEIKWVQVNADLDPSQFLN